MTFKLCILFLLTAVVRLVCTQNGEFELRVGDPCPFKNYKCKDGTIHHMCKEFRAQNHSCHMKDVQLSMEDKESFMKSLNGQRNKLAADWKIANMNNIYWTDELSRVAYSYFRHCSLKKDGCRIVGTEMVSINSIHDVRNTPLKGQWQSAIVASWFKEKARDFPTLADFLDDRITNHRNYTKFVQVMWPKTKFFGCGVTENSIDSTKSWYTVCYFHPPDNNQFHEILLGKPCSKCPPLREDCSTMFANLCGRDMLMEAGNKNKLPNLLWLLLYSAMLILLM